MTGIVAELKDEWQALANERIAWEVYWRDIARYVLPQTEDFNKLFNGSSSAAISAVVSQPVAAQRSKDIYDMTSLWAIDRLTAGLLSLKTPESDTWHSLTLDDFFGAEETHEEKAALERTRDYLFRVRSNPRSGFWPAHRSAMRSMCAFGDGWMFVEENPGTSAKLPYLYSYMPLFELFPAMSHQGQPNRMFRAFTLTAEQCMKKFNGKVPREVEVFANEPGKRHTPVEILHCIRPRDGLDRNSIGVRGAAFQSHYIMPKYDFHVGESGFYEFPFIRYSWSNTGARPYSEGPVAYAIAEIKSLQEMAKNELIASQVALRPAYATFGKNFQRINLNPGATNPGLINAEGRPLFAPLNTGARPDFAQAVMEARRNSVREMLYLNLWQIIIQESGQTATEALIRAQEKGEMLGPVGISLNEGLAMMVDREIGILGRKRAFDDDSPLAMPDSMADRGVAPTFTSPLDRLRRMGEVVGMQRLVEFAMFLSGNDPQRAAQIMARFDIDEMLDKAQEIFGAPISTLKAREAADEERGANDNMGQMMTMLQSMKAGGEGIKAIGEGAGAAAQGMEAIAQAPHLQGLMQQAPETMDVLQRAAG